MSLLLTNKLQTPGNLPKTAQSKASPDTIFPIFPFIENATDLLEEFQQRIGAPRQAVVQIRTAGEEITRAIKEARHLLKNRLDPLMRQFNHPGTHPDQIAKRLFHEAYQSARIIVDAPSRKKKAAEAIE